ncbi:MAG: hypothetical protein ABSC93_09870 [Bryobacteraceae bacterium]
MSGCVATFERTQDRLVGGVRHIDQDAQPVAFLHHVRTKCSQATEVRGIGIQIAEWSHHVVAHVKQLQMSQAALVHFADSIEVSLNEHGALYRLHDRRFPGIVRGLKIRQVQRPPHVSLVQSRID